MNLLGTAKRRAFQKGYDCDITIEWLESQWNKQNGCCALTGIPFELERNKRQGERFYTPYAPSIDKADPNLGYTKENVRLILVAMNIALNRFGDKVFEHIARKFLEKLDNAKGVA